jgi:tRNA 5-methylaminomethyl-2-thiouridine biosynthesis bifunctional protein
LACGAIVLDTPAIVPASIAFEADGTPRCEAFGDVYHARAGALQQARHVFLGGNRLPERWADTEHFVVLETGFGLGHNFLATWQSWRDDPQRPKRLVYAAVELHPPTAEDLARVHAGSSLPALGKALLDSWPPLTPGLHVLDFEGGAVRLLLSLGDAAQQLRRLVLSADAIYLDGFKPSNNARMWSAPVFAALGRLAAPHATAATWSVARLVQDGLRSAGFVVERRPGLGARAEMTCARFEPVFVPKRPSSRVVAHRWPQERKALIVGAGLAGAWAAHVLTRLGWACTVLDRHATVAAEASGNPGGLFHGTVHGQDGPHTRLNRACALFAAPRLRELITHGHIPGQQAGHLHVRGTEGVWGLDPRYAQAWSREAARARSGLPLPTGGWFYPGGGWASPAALCAHLLGQQGIDLRLGSPVARLARDRDTWCALDDRGQMLTRATVAIVATGAAGIPLVDPTLAAPLPAPRRVRGQISWCATDPRTAPLPMALSGYGYALTLDDGRCLFGATSQPDDEDATTREADHRHNVARLAHLTGQAPPAGQPLEGRTAWRAMSVDRLPMVGAWPAPLDAAEATARRDQARLVPRTPGLFMFGALGSRGMTWAPLAAEVLAAWIDGLPMPIESDLLDAIDPARFMARAHRKASS